MALTIEWLSQHAIVYAISYAIDYEIGYAIKWQNRDILNIVSKNHLREVGELLRSIYKGKTLIYVLKNHLREVGELLRRTSIKQRLSFMCKKLLGGVMLKAFLPCNNFHFFVIRFIW